NRAYALFLAEIEPVPGAAGNAQQIARFNRDGNDVSFARMNVKQAASFDDETHFVFVVPVFTVEAVEHRIKPWSCGRNIDHVGSNVAAFGFQAINFRSVRSENFSGGSACGKFVRWLPPFVGNADAGKIIADFRVLRESPLFIRNVYGRHATPSLASADE